MYTLNIPSKNNPDLLHIDNDIFHVFMDDGIKLGIQWPAGSQRLYYREKTEEGVNID